jgi:soluble lytic murein transglycosylase-like protein
MNTNTPWTSILLKILLNILIVGMVLSLIAMNENTIRKEIVDREIAINEVNEKIDDLKLSLSHIQVMEMYISSATERIDSYIDNKKEAHKIATIIWQTTRQYNIDPYWFEALGTHESARWNSRTSKSSDYGFWMVNVDTFYWLKYHPDLKKYNAKSVQELVENDKMSAEFAAVYLEKQLEMFGGKYELAIRAYNGGPGAVIGWRKGTSDLSPITKYHFKEVRNIYKNITKGI